MSKPTSRSAPKSQPSALAAMLRSAAERQRAGDSEAAERLYRQIVALHPDQHAAFHQLGAIAYKKGQTAEAVGFIRKAVDVAPENAIYRNDLGSALHRNGEVDDAIDCFRRAVGLRPDLAPAHFNLANSLMRNLRHAEAAASYASALALEPKQARWHDRLGRALKLSGDLAAARASFERALELDPNSADAMADLAMTYWTTGEQETAARLYRGALALDPRQPQVHSDLVYLLAYGGIERPAEILAEARRWERQHAAGLAAASAPHDNDPDPDRRLRIGYVSPDFRLHAVANFIEPVIEAHDRSRFEVHAYSQVRRPDKTTVRLEKRVDRWHPIVDGSDDAVAAQIRRDRIDLLIDLAGHTADNRLLVFARKPAPVQATWLGYMGTTGVSAIDYIIANRWLIPPEHRGYFSEAVFDVQHCAPFRFPIAPPPARPTPKRSQIVFGCFNNCRKLRDVVLEAWCRILACVPDARLILKSFGLDEPEVQAMFRRRFARHGADPDRIEFRGGTTFKIYLDGYRDIDVALDPFPGNGGTTTCDTLLMGVPVVTLWGETMAARVGGGTLSALGLGELVADSVDGYVDIAVRLACDGAERARLRDAIGHAVRTRGFTDMAHQTRDIEAAFREMWRRWCEGRRAA